MEFDYEMMVDELSLASENEGTEVGEGWRALEVIWGARSSYGEDFIRSLKEEISKQYDFYRTNWTWVEEKAKKCEHCGHITHSHKILVWNEELKYYK